MRDYLTKIYQWRLQFLLAHGGAAALHLDLAITASRILSVDEISLFLSPDSKDAFTVLLCTNAAGHIYLILVIFNGTTQLEDPLVYVEGVPFLVIFNDTHWNNTFAYRAFLQVLVQFLPSCCDSKKCSSHLLISDRFSGHDSPETAALLEEHRICPIVVEDTTRGAPNDFCFNHLIRTTFDNTQLQIHQDRAKANAFRELDGLPPHPNLTLDQKRQLAVRATPRGVQYSGTCSDEASTPDPAIL